MSSHYPQLLTVPEVAKLLSIHPRTAKRAIQAGDLPVVLLSDDPRGKRVRVSDLDAFIEQRRSK